MCARCETEELEWSDELGELEEELEDAPIEKIYDADGVTYILDIIQRAVETRSVHLKRQLLNNYEHFTRHEILPEQVPAHRARTHHRGHPRP